MQQTTVKVVNPNGIHCRPSSAIVKVARQYKSIARANCQQGSADLKSMIEIITLALHAGESVTLTTDGEDDVAALDALAKAFVAHYDYPDK